MTAEPARAVRLTEEADRLDELADVAELMDDPDNALALRRQAAAARTAAMAAFDD